MGADYVMENINSDVFNTARAVIIMITLAGVLLGLMCMMKGCYHAYHQHTDPLVTTPPCEQPNSLLPTHHPRRASYSVQSSRLDNPPNQARRASFHPETRYKLGVISEASVQPPALTVPQAYRGRRFSNMV